jgi:hypothetical protein
VSSDAPGDMRAARVLLATLQRPMDGLFVVSGMGRERRRVESVTMNAGSYLA